MMEPLILAYGRGELPEMPGAADTIVDVVPVDHVVAAIVAVLAHPPEVGDPGVLPRLVGRPQPADLPGALPQRARLLRRPPVHLRRPRRDPAAGVALPRLAVRRAAAQHQRARLQGGRLRHRARAAQRPHPRPGPQARPAGAAAGVPAPLPRALPGVRPGGAAVLRHQHAGALPLAVRRRPGDVRLRHGGRGLEGLPPGHPLPGRDGADPAPRRGPGRAQAADDAGARRALVEQARRRRVLRHGRHAAVLERDRDLPVAAAAGAVGHRAVRGAEPDRGQGAEPGPGRAPRAQRLPALGLPRVRRRAARPTSTRSPTSTSPTTCSTRLSPAAVRKIREHRAAGPPDGADHRRDPAADPPAAAALRPHRGGRAGRRRPRGVHRLPRLVAAGGGVAGGLDAAVRRRQRHRPRRRRTATPTRTPTCRCSRRSGARSPCAPTCRSSGTRARLGGRSSTGRARRPTPAPSTRQVVAHDARAGDVPVRAADRGRQGDGRPDARHPVRRSPRRCGWSRSTSRRSTGPAGRGCATRLSGICGSDLGALSGKTSLYFSAVVSLPFVPGHEVVAELLDDCEDLPAGTRVVVDPVLTCAARGVEPCESLRRPARPTGARGSPSATWRPVCRPASARTPAAAGASS